MIYWQNTYSIGEYLICNKDLYMSNGHICFFKNKKYRVTGVSSRGIELYSEIGCDHQIGENWTQYFEKENNANNLKNKRVIEV